MKELILAIVASALCTAGVCFYAFNRSTPRSATIDGTSEATFKTSIDAVKQGLPRPRLEEFEQAMTMLATTAVPPPKDDNALASLMTMSADPGAPARRLRSRVHGMTANEVIAAGAVGRDSLVEARRNANEAAAIATLRNIVSAQALCQASGDIDVNGNSAGEYGFFAELAGAVPVRGADKRIAPPVLSNTFGNVTDSRVTRSGYVFQVFLPDAKYAGVAEAATGGGAGTAVDPEKAEVLWCCYAWPASRGESGTRAFFVYQGGDILGCSNTQQQYDGATKVPKATAAFLRGTAGNLADRVAANMEGIDGETWLVVN